MESLVSNTGQLATSARGFDNNVTHKVTSDQTRDEQIRWAKRTIQEFIDRTEPHMFVPRTLAWDASCRFAYRRKMGEKIQHRELVLIACVIVAIDATPAPSRVTGAKRKQRMNVWETTEDTGKVKKLSHSMGIFRGQQ